MPGFSNGIVYANNVDFRGVPNPTPQIVSDGQLIIGKTGFNPVIGTLTAGAGIGIANGAGTITISNTGNAFPEQQIYYVGKHGNDASTGLSIDVAKLTFTAAITAATALTPSAINRFAIVCLDDGIYAEAITCVSFVDIYAPNATLTGTIVTTDDVNIKLYALNVADATIGVFKDTGTDYSNVDIDVVTCVASGIGFVTINGLLNCKWKQLFVENGFGVGDISSNLTHMHVTGGDIYISGTGVGIARAFSGSTVGHIDHILDIGAGVGTAVDVLDGSMDINVNKIDSDTAYNVNGATSILNLFCNSITGTRTVAAGGTEKVTVPYDLSTTGQVLTSNGPGVDPTFQPASGGGMTWQTIGASGALVVNNGYICTAGAALSFSLPAASAIGDTIALVLDGSTSWTITQAANQYIRLGSSVTTTGVGGSLASTARGDTITMVCREANLGWIVISSIGNITVV
jgi:hypothetical protein